MICINLDIGSSFPQQLSVFIVTPFKTESLILQLLPSENYQNWSFYAEDTPTSWVQTIFTECVGKFGRAMLVSNFPARWWCFLKLVVTTWQSNFPLFQFFFLNFAWQNPRSSNWEAFWRIFFCSEFAFRGTEMWYLSVYCFRINPFWEIQFILLIGVVNPNYEYIQMYMLIYTWERKTITHYLPNYPEANSLNIIPWDGETRY